MKQHVLYEQASPNTLLGYDGAVTGILEAGVTS